MSRVAVIGGGLMGHGIALTMARAGHRVAVSDPSPEALATVPQRIAESLKPLGAEAETEDVLARVELCSTLAEAVAACDFAFEAGPEKLEIKHAIFADIEANAPADAILASNTSVIQITKIMAHLDGQHRAMGTHWWNPPHMIPLVEVVKTEWTDHAKAQAMFDLLRQNLIFNYAVLFVNAHPDLKRDFRIDQAALDGFRKFLDEREFEMEPGVYEEHKDLIALRLKAQIARVKWDQIEEARVLAGADPQIQEALQRFGEAARLAHNSEPSESPVAL